MSKFVLKSKPAPVKRSTVSKLLLSAGQYDVIKGSELLNILQKAQADGCALEDVTIEIQQDYYDDYCTLTVQYNGLESEEAFAARQAEYERRLAEYEEWYATNKKEIKAEKRRRQELKQNKEAQKAKAEIEKLRKRIDSIEKKIKPKK